jgi:hypothetical protein
MRLSILFLAPLVAVLMAACQPRTVLDPGGLSIIRTYRLAVNVSDPQPAWNPGSYLIVARSQGGFALLQEGQGRQERFESQESRQTWYPAWINRDQFVFGPMRNVAPVADGRIVASTDGLTVVKVVDNGLRCDVTRTPLCSVGFRPRPANDKIYAQAEAKMILVDRDGVVSDAGEGFYPEPQANGDGIAWQETPIFEPDRWTGKTGLGRLFIRWRSGVITEVLGGCEPRWTADGGLVCTVLRATPEADRPWWSVGTDVVYVASPEATPELIAKDARNPQVHPKEPLIAVSDGSAGVRVVSLRTPRPNESLLVTTGTNPQWSYDGTRLLTVEVNPDAGQSKPNAVERPASIVVHVLKEKRTTL